MAWGHAATSHWATERLKGAGGASPAPAPRGGPTPRGRGGGGQLRKRSFWKEAPGPSPPSAARAPDPERFCLSAGLPHRLAGGEDTRQARLGSAVLRTRQREQLSGSSSVDERAGNTLR